MYEVKTASRRAERQLDKVDDEIYLSPSFPHSLPYLRDRCISDRARCSQAHLYRLVATQSL